MRKELFDLAEELQSAMDDSRLGQELLTLAEYGTLEDVGICVRILHRFKSGLL